MSARPVIMSTRSVIVRRLQYEGSRILNRTVSLLVLPFFEKRANVLKNCFTLMVYIGPHCWSGTTADISFGEVIFLVTLMNSRGG